MRRILANFLGHHRLLDLTFAPKGIDRVQFEGGIITNRHNDVVSWNCLSGNRFIFRIFLFFIGWR